MPVESHTGPLSASLPRLSRGTWAQAWGRRQVLRLFSLLRSGEVVICEGDREYRLGAAHGPSFRLEVYDPAFYNALALGGSVGAGEAYTAGWWGCHDLPGLIALLVRDYQVIAGMDSGWGALLAPVRRWLHARQRNTLAGSRRNIAAHYDLGNDFFQLWLDPTLSYSSAIYERADMTLPAAAVAKLARVCRKLDLQPTDHLLEIGTGWGGLAIHAARHHGCRVTTTTISAVQYELTKARVAAAGLSERVTVLCQDYRALSGQYDKLVSIEMIEAVGQEYVGAYFAQCSRLLQPGGMMLLQAITIQDQRFQAAVREVDFIKRYIFPGSFIPSVTVMLAALTRHSDMRLFHLEDIGPHYARTLADWRSRFLAQRDAVRRLGFSEAFLRQWEYYLAYCEGGFRERALGTVQMLLTKPECRRASLLGTLPPTV